MRLARLAAPLACAWLLAGAAAQGSLEVAFQAPGQAGGASLQAERAAWALVLFHGPAWASLEVRLERDAAVENRTFLEPLPRTFLAVPSVNDTLRAGTSIEAGFPRGPVAVLYLEAASLRLDTQASAGRLDRMPGGTCLGALASGEQAWFPHLLADHCAAGDSAALRLDPAGGNASLAFTLQATGVTFLEWNGAQVHCSRPAPCPGDRPALPSPVRRTARFTSYDRLQLQGGEAVLAGGTAATVLVGAPELDVALRGWLRLPLASAPPCGDCIPVEGQTLVPAGNLSLGRLRMQGGGLAATLSGDVRAVRLDESSVDPALVFGPGAGGALLAAAGLALALRLAGAFFTRDVRGARALDHPKRRLLHDAIVANPGLTFADLLRLTGLGNGTAEHHLRILVRHGLLACNRDGNRRHYFENHGRYRRSWTRIAALRGAKARRLFDLLRSEPGISQAGIIGQAAGWGWSRTTTQRVLKGLVRARLAVATRHANRLLYRVSSDAGGQGCGSTGA